MKNILAYIYISLMLLMLLASSADADEDEYIIFAVEKGHNLFEICSKHLEDWRKWRKIAKMNDISDPFTIYPKDKIKIPTGLLKGIPVNGRVTFIKGDVTVQSENSNIWHELRQGSEIEQGITLKTGEESSVEISYEEGFSMCMRADYLLGNPLVYMRQSLWICATRRSLVTSKFYGELKWLNYLMV